MFKVEFSQDEHDEKVMWLKASHNGVAWSNIEIRNADEALQIINALQQGVQRTAQHAAHDFDCSIHIGYGLCNCGVNLRRR
jgi:hypothetical protein